MPLQAVAQTLDPADFVVSPHVAALDTFRMTDDTGGFVANITPEYLQKLIAHMNEREALTGDLAPIVIGHTTSGLPETEQPPVVGFARNWTLSELGSTGRPCAFFDAWIYKTQVDLARKFPRRSCEVWASRYEVDPISLLGATTPARDLGLMKLSRDGSCTYYSPGDATMPEEKKDEPKKDAKKDEPKADPKEAAPAKKEDGEKNQILALLTQILEAVTGGAGAAPAAAGAPPADAGAPPAAGAPAGESDEDMEKLLQELMGQGAGAASGAPPADEGSRAGDKPTANSAGYPGGADTVVPYGTKAKMSREEQELSDLRAEVTRMKVKDALVKLNRKAIADPDDEALVTDLVAMPPEVRQRQIDRWSKTPAAPGEAQATHLNRALDERLPIQGKRMTQSDATKLSRKAAAEGKTFEQVAAEAGFDLN